MTTDPSRRPRRSRSAWIAGALAFAFIATSEAAEQGTLEAPVTLEATVDVPRDSLPLGAPFDLSIRIVHPGLERLALATRAADLEPFELADWTRELDRGDTAHVRLTLRAFRVGELVLPPLTITGRTADGSSCVATTGSAGVRVASVVPEGESAPRDIKEAVALGSDRRLWLYALLAALGVAAILFFLWRRRREAALDEVRGSRPAHEIALAALEKLSASDLARVGPWKEFYTELTAIVRYYIVQRFGVDAPDLTTGETLRALLPFSLSEPVTRSLREILVQADQVKFAKEVPAPEGPSRHLAGAVAFVRATVGEEVASGAVPVERAV
jgi:hypothetical protein